MHRGAHALSEARPCLWAQTPVVCSPASLRTWQPLNKRVSFAPVFFRKDGRKSAWITVYVDSFFYPNIMLKIL